MTVSQSEVAENAASMTGLVAQLRERLARVYAGGGPEAVARHRSRNKLTARERIERLADPGSAFLEFSRRSPPSGSTTTRARAPGSSPGSLWCKGATAW